MSAATIEENKSSGAEFPLILRGPPCCPTRKPNRCTPVPASNYAGNVKAASKISCCPENRARPRLLAAGQRPQFRRIGAPNFPGLRRRLQFGGDGALDGGQCRL